MYSSIVSRVAGLSLASLMSLASVVQADENLWSTVKGAEPLPADAKELKLTLNNRSDKGQGDYSATDVMFGYETGITNKLTVEAAIKALRMDTSGLIINGYLPENKQYGLKFSGIEAALKYNFLSVATSPVGLSTYTSLNLDKLDPHSGQSKDKVQLEQYLLLQKYLLDGQLVLAGNANIETTYAKRAEIKNLPEEIEWPVHPEMEIGLGFGLAAAYRFVPNWTIGVESFYQTEFETEVGQERWSVFAGPSLHYGANKYWVTASYLTQLKGGGEQYDGQMDADLHLIEKTKREMKLKIGINF